MLAIIGVFTALDNASNQFLGLFISGEQLSKASQEKAHQAQFWTRPLFPTLLVLGVCAGAPAGIYARTHNRFGADNAAIQWQGFNFYLDERQARVNRALAQEINWWASQVSGEEPAPEEMKQEIAAQFLEVYIGSAGPKTSSNPTTVPSSETLADRGVLYSSGINSSFCTDLRMDYDKPALLADRIEQFRQKNAEKITENFNDTYFEDPTLLAGALLWLCTQDNL